MIKKAILFGVEFLLSLVIAIFYFILLGKSFALSLPILIAVIILPILIVLAFFLPNKTSSYIMIAIPVVSMVILALLIDSQIYDFSDYFSNIVMFGDKNRVPLHFTIDIFALVSLVYGLSLILINPKKE